ncbi:hypothetical protein DAPPUDRAFT_118976 [Daphnia pulex]|uniref:Uncharacterized protein n=1 Tax=Daphnia pulex TaxID=6669 RepID=E9HX58_DAPPU|nr:hypothetical protein DAPPUDRAFT_118976 [Daphnia pulex]|eukprot:EFX63666.1 hypothetical protein DAPPUDRAFT_118976 [Daphnia pulex]
MLDYHPIILETTLVYNASGSARLRLANSSTSGKMKFANSYKDPMLQSLRQALALEAKFQPKLQLLSTASNTGESGEIKCSMRDGAAHVLRCFKVWYDLPSAVLLD